MSTDSNILEFRIWNYEYGTPGLIILLERR